MVTKTRSGSLTNRYKKQHGLHHKHSKHYLKVYTPFLPILIVTFAGILTSIAILSARSSFASTGANLSVNNLLRFTNQQRQNNNMSGLSLNNKLDSAAQAKANNMSSVNYWSHVSPSRQTPWQFMEDAGYQFQSAGENLAYGFNDSSNLLNSWMNSPDHRANILNVNYKDVGFGIAYSSNYQNKGPEYIVVAMYAAPAGSVLAASTVSPSSNATPYTSTSLVQPVTKSVARVETFGSKYPSWTFIALGFIIGISSTYLVLKHTNNIRKWVIKEEKLVVKHPMIDLVIVIVLVGSAVLYQTVGFIR